MTNVKAQHRTWHMLCPWWLLWHLFGYPAPFSSVVQLLPDSVTSMIIIILHKSSGPQIWAGPGWFFVFCSITCGYSWNLAGGCKITSLKCLTFWHVWLDGWAQLRLSNEASVHGLSSMVASRKLNFYMGAGPSYKQCRRETGGSCLALFLLISRSHKALLSPHSTGWSSYNPSWFKGRGCRPATGQEEEWSRSL